MNEFTSIFFAQAPGGLSASTNSWNWSEVAKVVVEGGGLKLTLGPAAIGLSILLLGAWLIWRFIFANRTFRNYEVVEAELNIANIGKVKLQPNDEVVRVAYQAWVEISTRKAGLAFDENHDVIVEVYSSWYEAFGRLRDLAKSIPAQNIHKSEDTRKLVELIVRVLNDGLRPHLTTWQAKFRKWYAVELEKEKSASISPQEIQKRYPEYTALVSDLTQVQSQIVQYRDFLWKVAEGKKR